MDMNWEKSLLTLGIVLVFAVIVWWSNREDARSAERGDRWSSL